MKIVFYKDKKTDKIIGYHIAPELEEEELQQAVREHNANEKHTSIAVVIDADEYLQFLFEKAEAKRLFPQKAIDEALEALSEATNCILCLDKREK